MGLLEGRQTVGQEEEPSEEQHERILAGPQEGPAAAPMVEGLAGGQQEEGPAGLPEGPPKGPQRLPPPALEQAPLLQQLDLGSRHRVSAVRSSNTGAGAREGVGTWRRSGTLPGTVGRGPGLGSLCSCR